MIFQYINKADELPLQLPHPKQCFVHYHCNQGGKICSSLLRLAVSHKHAGRHDQFEIEDILLLKVNFSSLTDKDGMDI